MGGRRLIYDSALRELFRLRSLEGPLTRPIRASLVLLAAAPSCLFARIPQTSSSIAIEAVLVNPKENRDWPAGAKMAFRWTAVSRAQMASYHSAGKRCRTRLGPRAENPSELG